MDVGSADRDRLAVGAATRRAVLTTGGPALLPDIKARTAAAHWRGRT